MRSGGSSPRQSPGLLGRIKRSIFPDPLIPRSKPERRAYLVKNLILHFRPALVTEKTLRFSLTWGLGGMAVALVLLQLGTGLLLKFAYEPTPIGAYESIRSLQNDVPFGQLVRNLHHWCGNILALVAFLQFADSEEYNQLPRDYGIGLFLSGTIGAVILFLFFGILWRKRKIGSVNQDIYDRQVASVVEDRV